MNLDLSQSLLDALPIGVVVLDDRGTVLGANRWAARLTGNAPSDLAGRRFLEGLASPEDLRRTGELLDRPSGGQLDFWATFRPEDREIDVRIALRTFDDDRRYAVAVLDENDAGTFHHKINNLLMGLVGHLELLTSCDLPDEARRHANDVTEQVERIREQVELTKPQQ